MNVLWLGVAQHSPKEDLKFSIHKNLFYTDLFEDTFYKYAEKNGFTMAEISNVKLEGDMLYVNNNEVKLEDYDYLLFTYNYAAVTNDMKSLMQKIEDEFRTVSNGKVLNSIYNHKLLQNKIDFFTFLKNEGYSDYVPSFYEKRMSLDFIKSVFNKKFILRKDAETGGDGVCISKHWFSKLLYLLVNINKKLFTVEYINNYFKEDDVFVSYRVFVMGNRVTFAYPHITHKSWCVHTDSKDYSPNKEVYLKYNDEGYKIIKENKGLFEKLTSKMELSTCCFDIVIRDSKIYLLETELKYGCDSNYTNGQYNRYSLDCEYLNKYSFIENISFDIILKEDV